MNSIERMTQRVLEFFRLRKKRSPIRFSPSLPPHLFYMSTGTRTPEDEFLFVTFLCARSNVTIDLGGRVIRGPLLSLARNTQLRNGTIESYLPIVLAEGAKDCVLANLFIIRPPPPLDLRLPDGSTLEPYPGAIRIDNAL